MTRRLRNRLFEIFMLFALAAATAVVMPRAHAGMIATDEAQAPAVQAERERVKAMLARPEVMKQMRDLGVAPGDVQGRVDAMTDGEVIQLAGRIDQLAAGGAAFTNDQLIIILLIVILLVILL